jgi:hypothetical protein
MVIRYFEIVSGIVCMVRPREIRSSAEVKV